MKGRINLILILMTVLTVGCSEVEFSPSPQNSGQTVPGPVDCVSNCEKEKVTDVFNQNNSQPKVDILFVVDNSPSMYEEQLKLGEKISSFLSKIENVDWQIAFTTTDVSSGEYGLQGEFLNLSGASGKLLNKNTPNYEKVFLNTVVRKESLCSFTCASSDEQPLMATVLALSKKETVNKNFFRPDANFVTVYLSDEDEMSIGPKEATKAKTVLDTVKLALGSKKLFTAFGIVVRPGDQSCKDQGQVSPHNYATHVAELVDKTKGVLGSLCDADYGKSLEKIGNHVSNLVHKFKLKAKPIKDSVKVRLNPEQNLKFEIDDDTLAFETAPAAGTIIEIEYETIKKN